MTRIDSTFAQLAKQGKKGFIAYITAGDPSLADTVDIVLRLEEAGVDIVELGIPFSDPLADGRVNQESANRALDAGTTPAGVLDTIAALRERTQIPIMCYTYLNPYHAAGFESMMRRSAKAGVDGLLFLDMPVEESDELVDLMRRYHLNNISLVTPTTPPARIKKIVQTASGFIYCVSRIGVTGAQSELAAGAEALVRVTKKHSRLPVALGFGVSTPELAAQSAKAADAVVVGSAIVQRFHAAGTSAAGRRRAAAWVGSMVNAVKEL
ncbi:MAG TPA: tryptophan synthase subunit alpha [Kiritimatiellia bacterium]|nr:tryptophan synthase subunit alpha [Kiritimatiellia bacterium]HMO97920.1 tryptophan synthase subunit alpha [Kiritimatiellia bacterium]HMP95271.1 tryptophan synthase subunit alpha [Kiritimatiellia bacterium]